MMIALGEAFTGVFTASPSLYNALAGAGAAESDRMWAMPLDEEGFGPQIYDSSNADLCNTGGRSDGSCTAELFLKKFVERVAGGEHVDIAETVEEQRKGVTGSALKIRLKVSQKEA